MLTRGDIDQRVARNRHDLNTRAVGADVDNHRRVVAKAGDLLLVTCADIAAVAVTRVRADDENVEGAAVKRIRGRLSVPVDLIVADVHDSVGEIGTDFGVEEARRRRGEKNADHQDGERISQEAKAPKVNSRVLDRSQIHVTHHL